jgi:putative two-component system response regulator
VSNHNHILIAEDNPALIEVMREILETEGYRVTCAGNGNEALKAFEAEQPDLILSDVMMPQMDGFALLEAIRMHPAGAAVPFLFVSARTEQTATSRARVLGADDYIFKPFDADELSLAVRAKLQRRRAVELFDSRSAHVQTVLMLANVIEARDEYTRGHIGRVQKYAMDLAEALGWDAEELAILEFGALLHDIGKVVVPRAILNKPAHLDPGEWAVMRQHPEVGAHMLSGVDHLQPAIAYALHHHEHWDGNGYPSGLAGNNIPIEGRLLTIADTFDAMTTQRPYHAARSKSEALEEIKRLAGIQFDPIMVETFYKLHHRSS